ncbi:hypothetical protein [Rosistilla oblonga]|uniref:hypothetical protein n=1 Tax=Rosistilla oblonga TaxID=2527990 RepID=UPI003A969740
MLHAADQQGNHPNRAPHNRIGTLAQQMAAIGLSIYLGDRRGTTAAEEWDDAHRLIVPHRRREVEQ